MSRRVASGLFPWLMALAVASCATPYQPDGFMGGYSEVLLAPRTYEISFKGNGWTSGPRARQMALRRAAELTVQRGLYGFYIRSDRASVRTSTTTSPVSCTTIGATTSCTGGDTNVISKPQSDLTITMVSNTEAAALSPQMLVYDARLILGLPAQAPVVASAPAPPQPASPRVAARPAALRRPSVWVGSYTCGQGTTGLKLTISASSPADCQWEQECSQVSPSAIDAIFEFFPVAENPTVPTGSFTMTGKAVGRRLALRPAAWMVHPPGLEMVGLSGDVSADGNTISGSIDHVGCGSFSLATLQELPPVRQPRGDGPAAPLSAPASASPPPPASSAALLVFGGEGHRTFLGCLTCSEFDSDSVFNEFGSHGSEFATDSIHNQFGEFGSEFSDHSACNPYANDPPVVVDKVGGFHGRLTLNQFREQISDPAVVAWLGAVCHH